MNSKKLLGKNLQVKMQSFLASTLKASAKTPLAQQSCADESSVWLNSKNLLVVLKCLLTAWYPENTQEIAFKLRAQGSIKPHRINGISLTSAFVKVPVGEQGSGEVPGTCSGDKPLFVRKPILFALTINKPHKIAARRHTKITVGCRFCYSSHAWKNGMRQNS